MRRVGYARVSTIDQDTSLQMDALKRAGVRTVFREAGSGVGPRPELQRAISSLSTGDVLVVWKIDRVARGLGDLIAILARLKAVGAAITSLTEPLDTASPIGEFTFQILGAVAQLERSMIRERVIAGQAAARARGKTWGHPRALSDSEVAAAVDAWRSGWYMQATIADMLGVSVACLRDHIHRYEGRGRWAKKSTYQLTPVKYVHAG
jgi:DNA invertase Pin-like site-specific DNA recombinase